MAADSSNDSPLAPEYIINFRYLLETLHQSAAVQSCVCAPIDWFSNRNNAQNHQQFSFWLTIARTGI